MYKAVKVVFFSVLIGICLLVAYQSYDRQFKLGNITVDWPAKSDPDLTDERSLLLAKIFNQPFLYLDRGKQSFVFVSSDNNYVVKFFDTRCLQSGSYPWLFSLDEEHCRKKLTRLVKGYKTAVKYDSGHNGIVYMQLAPNPAFQQKVTLHDRFGVRHEIDLSKVPFILQQKAIPLREMITGLLRKGDVGQAKRRYRQVIDMYVDGYRRGVFDRDHNFMYNVGFVGEEPIRIDVGRLQHNEAIMQAEAYMKDLRKVAVERLGDWLYRHFPEYRDEIVRDAEDKLNEVSQSSSGSSSSSSSGSSSGSDIWHSSFLCDLTSSYQ
jgi:hypothetical protein